PRMARKKRPHKTSPKTPSRVRKRRGKKTKTRAHHHPELVGLGLAGLGVFLAAILWFGFSGGPVAHLAKDAIGAAAYLTPLVLVLTGASLGAILRRTGRVVHHAQARVRRPRPNLIRAANQIRESPPEPPVDVKHDYPDLVTDSVSYRPEPDSFHDAPTHESQE